jgi:hypothetical protein
MSQLQQPVMYFNDLDGSPLDNGSLYFGTVNLNPETSPIIVYWDAALTQIAAQPVRTSNGRPVRNGTIAALFAGSDFSLTVKNKSGSLVYYAPKSADVYSAFTQSLLAAPDAATARTVLGAVAKIGDTMSGDLVLNNTTADTPNIKFTDPVNNTSSYWDEKLERVRLVTSYRGGAETERIGVNANTGEIAINGSAGAVGSVLQSNGAGVSASWGAVSVMGFSNKLINGDFRVDYANPIGNSVSAAAGSYDIYAFNRWYLGSNGNTSFGRVKVQNGRRFLNIYTSASGSNTGVYFGQRIEAQNCISMGGDTYSIKISAYSTTALTLNWAIYTANATDSFGAYTSTSGQTLVSSGSFSLTTAVADFSAQVTFPTGAPAPSDNGVAVIFSTGAISSGTEIYATDISLTRGGVAPLVFERRPISVELELCQRYAPVVGLFNTQSYIGTGYNTSTTTAITKIPLPVLARSNFTGAKFYGGTYYSWLLPNGNTAGFTTTTSSGGEASMFYFSHTGTALTNGAWFMLNCGGEQAVGTGCEL